MISSKVNSLLFTISVIFIGCATSKYHANKPNTLGTDIIVSSDRVVTECEFIDNYTGAYKNPHGFMIHILDNQKRVITVSNSTVLDKKNCFERLEAANRIIQKGGLITVRGRGDADGPSEKSKFSSYFPKHGTFPHTGPSLNFLAIWNDKGQCYDAFSGSDKPCPSNP